MKRSKRLEAARAAAEPAAPETWVQTATGKVAPLAAAAAAAATPLAQKAAPLAQSAAARAVPLTTAAAAAVPLAKGAAAKIGPFTQQAVDAASPYAQQAADAVTAYAHAVADKVAPYVELDAVTPYAQQAADAVTSAAHAVAEKVTPYAELAAGRIAPLAAGGVQAGRDAVEKVGPAVEAARDRVSDEVLPKITTALTAAAGSPLAVEAAKRGRATVAAARGELSLPLADALAVPDKKKPSWLKRFAVVAAVGGTVAIIARRLMGPSDSGWQAARPSAPTTTPPTGTSTTTTPSTPPASEPAPTAGAPLDEIPEAEGTRAGDPLAGITTQPGSEETSAVQESTTDTATSSYGEGSYVGSEPPEGFTVKGNVNSNKYHLPEGEGYEATIAEVWFVDSDAAERAGFVRAQG